MDLMTIQQALNPVEGVTRKPAAAITKKGGFYSLNSSDWR